LNCKKTGGKGEKRYEKMKRIVLTVTILALFLQAVQLKTIMNCCCFPGRRFGHQRSIYWTFWNWRKGCKWE